MFIRGDRRNTLTSSHTNVTTLNSVGTLRTGNQNIPIPAPTTPNFAAVGNPFVSPIDFDAVMANTGNAALIQNRFWMWDPHLSTTGAWRLVKFESGSWRAVPAPYTDDNPIAVNIQHIQPGQAILVEPIAAGNLLIEENDKSSNTGNTNFRPFEAPDAAKGMIEINLELNEKSKFKLADGVLATIATT